MPPSNHSSDSVKVHIFADFVGSGIQASDLRHLKKWETGVHVSYNT